MLVRNFCGLGPSRSVYGYCVRNGTPYGYAPAGGRRPAGRRCAKVVGPDMPIRLSFCTVWPLHPLVNSSKYGLAARSIEIERGTAGF